MKDEVGLGCCRSVRDELKGMKRSRAGDVRGNRRGEGDEVRTEGIRKNMRKVWGVASR